MKKLFFLMLILVPHIMVAQIIQDQKMFTKFSFSLLGGLNFNSLSTLGGSLQIEGKINITSRIYLKLSTGFSSIFEDKEYLIKSYGYFNIENKEGYQLKTYSINQLEYSVIPLNIGIDYFLNENDFSPFGIFEIGYNFYSREEQILSSASGAIYHNKSDIPSEYLNNAPKTLDKTSWGIGLGVGMRYKISASFGLSARYMYRYYESIINTNQLLLGINF